jgi:hypothetical protein
MSRPYIQHGLLRHRPSGSDPVAPDPWWSIAADPATTWDEDTTYAKGDEVADQGDGVIPYANWISVQDSNLNQYPPTDGDDFTPGSWWICKELLFLDLDWDGDGPSVQLRLVTGPPWETDYSHHIAFKGVTSDLTYSEDIGTGRLCWLPLGYRPSDQVRIPIVSRNGDPGFAEYSTSNNTVNLNDPTGNGVGSGWFANFIF